MKHILELREKVKSKTPVVGTMVSSFDTPEMARIMKNCGFDYFLMDAEHGPINYDRVGPLFAYARMVGIVGIMRLSEISKTEIFHALDMGADGIACPNVETADQARELIRLSKYPPMGQRGMSMTRPHTGYQKVFAPDYVEQCNKNLFVICQIESQKGIDNLDEIMSVEGVDGVIIGPNDLSCDLGIVGQLENPRFIAAVEEISRICLKHGKFAGINEKNIENMDFWIDRGLRFNQWGADAVLYMQAAKQGFQNWKEKSKYI